MYLLPRDPTRDGRRGGQEEAQQHLDGQKPVPEQSVEEREKPDEARRLRWRDGRQIATHRKLPGNGVVGGGIDIEAVDAPGGGRSHSLGQVEGGENTKAHQQHEQKQSPWRDTRDNQGGSRARSGGD
jgi:hypothetical protein